MRTTLPVLACLSLAAGFAAAGEVTYYLPQDSKYVNIVFQGDTDLETIVGSTMTASGEVKVDVAAETGSESITIPVASMKTGIDLRDEHMCSAMWLDEKKCPDITFVSKSAKKSDDGTITVVGDFTLHGVTKEITVQVAWKELPPEAAKKARFPDGRWLKFTTAFDVKLSDYGVKVPELAVASVSDTWSVKVSLFAGTAKPEKK